MMCNKIIYFFVNKKEFDVKINKKIEKHYMSRVFDMILLFLSYVILLSNKIYNDITNNNYTDYYITNTVLTYTYILVSFVMIILSIKKYNEISKTENFMIILYIVGILYKLFPLYSSFIMLNDTTVNKSEYDYEKILIAISGFLTNTVSVSTLLITLPFSIMNISNRVGSLYDSAILGILKYMFSILCFIIILVVLGVPINLLVFLNKLGIDITNNICILLIIIICIFILFLTRITFNNFLSKQKKLFFVLNIIQFCIGITFLVYWNKLIDFRSAFSLTVNIINNYLLSYICIFDIINKIYVNITRKMELSARLIEMNNI